MTIARRAPPAGPVRDERGDAGARAASVRRSAARSRRRCARSTPSDARGHALQRELLERTRALRRLTAAIRGRLPAVREAFDARSRERVAAARGTPDLEPQRLAQEIVALAERGDVTEELVRLDSHLAALGGDAARGGRDREARRVPAPGGPARAQHDRLEGRRPRRQRSRRRRQGRGGKAPRASAEHRVMLITISGLPGSGKTTVARLVAAELGLEHVYARATSSAARRRRPGSRCSGVPAARRDRSDDRPPARRSHARARARRERGARGRLAAFMAERGGRRRAQGLPRRLRGGAGRRGSPTARAGRPASACREIQARETSDRQRYRDIYGSITTTTRCYDVVVETDRRTPEDLAQEIVRCARVRFGG